MNDLISAKKALDLIEKWMNYFDVEGKTALKSMEAAIIGGHLAPDPEPIPDIQPGDRVRHANKEYEHYGVGIVDKLSKSGKTARVKWPNYDRKRFPFGGPYPANFLLHKLVKLKEDIPHE
jgi:hypothetical protein